jgi:Cys-rich protein (TIGR01571 family)
MNIINLAMSESPDSFIRVVSPATLNEDFTFDVLVDGEPFTVLVPKGGVKEGQEFEVPFLREGENKKDEDEYEYDDSTLPVQSGSEEEDECDGLVPKGHWRNKLCSCCDVVTQATFWMACCCTPILIAQLLTRLRLTWKGQEGSKEEISLSFNRIVLSLILTLAASKIPLLGFFFLLAFFLVVVVYVGSNVRKIVRKKYKIPSTLPSKCGERVDDCCCMLFCGCCSTIQMARHTHDDKEYPGYGCTTTGLGMNAPELV